MDIDVLAIAAVAITVVLFVLLSYLGRKKHLRPSPVCISDRIDTDRFHRNSRSSGNLHSNNHSTVYCSRTSGRDYLLWSSIFVTLMANKIGGLQFGIYRNCQISSRVFHTAVAALPLTKANRSDFE